MSTKMSWAMDDSPGKTPFGDEIVEGEKFWVSNNSFHQITYLNQDKPGLRFYTLCFRIFGLVLTCGEFESLGDAKAEADAHWATVKREMASVLNEILNGAELGCLEGNKGDG